MKKNSLLKPYLKGLIKDHFGYIIFDIGLVSLILVFAYLNIPRIPDNQNKISSLKNEVKNLQFKYDTFNNSTTSARDLKLYLDFLNKLVPNSEDYFSLIYSLEKVSKKTNFIINSYTVNMKQSTSNKLKLTIAGSGDRTAFVGFLQNYNFNGGRLITSDKIELNPELEGDLKINVTFYNYQSKPNASPDFQTSLLSLQETASLYNKINISLKDEAPTNEQYIYPKKTSPF